MIPMILKREKILVIKSDKIKNLNKDFQKVDENFIRELEKEGEYKTRHLMEEDPAYDQFIPYIAVIKDNKVLTYLRGKKGGEEKLYDNYSVAVGGHVDEPDSIMEAAIREIEEEIGYDAKENELEIVGLLNPNLTRVDKYHIGIAMILKVPENFEINKGETDILLHRSFDTAEELKEKIPKMEN